MHTLQFPVGRLDADVLLYGPEDATHYGIPSWSLKNLQRKADVAANHLLVDRLAEELGGLGVLDAFAPNVAAASGVIINPDNLTDRIWIKNTRLHRDYDFPADGVLLQTGQAFVMSAAGCPVIIASAKNDLIVAHAARDSLIARSTLNGRPTRDNFSVVDAIIEKFKFHGAFASDIVMTMLCSIPAKKFEHCVDHPIHGAYNRKLLAYVDTYCTGGILREDDTTYLDLEKVFVEQARRAGVRTAYATHPLSTFADLVQTAESGERNLIIVKRSS